MVFFSLSLNELTEIALCDSWAISIEICFENMQTFVSAFVFLSSENIEFDSISYLRCVKSSFRSTHLCCPLPWFKTVKSKTFFIYFFLSFSLVLLETVRWARWCVYVLAAWCGDFKSHRHFANKNENWRMNGKHRERIERKLNRKSN